MCYFLPQAQGLRDSPCGFVRTLLRPNTYAKDLRPESQADSPELSNEPYTGLGSHPHLALLGAVRKSCEAHSLLVCSELTRALISD